MTEQVNATPGSKQLCRVTDKHSQYDTGLWARWYTLYKSDLSHAKGWREQVNTQVLANTDNY